MKTLILAIFIGLMIFSIPCLAEELYQYEAEVEIFENLSSHTQIKLIFSNSTFEGFFFTLEGSPQNLKITSDANCLKTEKEWGVRIACNFGSKKGETFSILVDYDSDDLVADRDGYHIFKNSYKVPAQTKNLIVLVRVPEGMGIINPSEDREEPYTPSTASVGTDGRRPILAWKKEGAPMGDGLDISVAFEEISLIPDYSGLISMQLVIALVIIIAVVTIYRVYSKRKSGIRIVLPVLKKDEKIVFEKLLEHKGSVNQKILVKESNYSKAKVSKVLKSLQERGLIRLERIGRTNKVHLVRDFRKQS